MPLQLPSAYALDGACLRCNAILLHAKNNTANGAVVKRGAVVKCCLNGTLVNVLHTGTFY